MTSFKEKVSHAHQTKHVLGRKLETGLQVFSSLFKLAFLKEYYTQLTEGFVVLRIVLDYKFIVRDWSIEVLGG